VVNGVIYGHEEIRADLDRDFGYKFKGHSDCEVVVALYKHYGHSFLNQLRVEFALCLYDETKELFVAVRDTYGIKPLFWTVVDGKLLVAS
jgi:asparagine synthase (glutamine-hydrolysing)